MELQSIQMPNAVTYKMNNEGGIVFFFTVRVEELSSEQAKEVAESMKIRFMEHWEQSVKDKDNKSIFDI